MAVLCSSLSVRHAPLRDENLVSVGVRPGLTHAVYEVDDLDAEYARISAVGTEVLVEPTQVSAAFGRRRLAFFRSPGGFVFEVMQVLERKILIPKALLAYSSVHTLVHHHFNQERHLVTRSVYKQRRSAASEEWRALAAQMLLEGGRVALRVEKPQLL